MQDSDEFLRLLFDFLDAELRAAVLQMPLREALLVQKQPTKWESDGISSSSSSSACSQESRQQPLQASPGSSSSSLSSSSVSSSSASGVSVVCKTVERGEDEDAKKSEIAVDEARKAVDVGDENRRGQAGSLAIEIRGKIEEEEASVEIKDREADGQYVSLRSACSTQTGEENDMKKNKKVHESQKIAGDGDRTTTACPSSLYLDGNPDLCRDVTQTTLSSSFSTPSSITSNSLKDGEVSLPVKSQEHHSAGKGGDHKESRHVDDLIRSSSVVSVSSIEENRSIDTSSAIPGQNSVAGTGKDEMARGAISTGEGCNDQRSKCRTAAGVTSLMTESGGSENVESGPCMPGNNIGDERKERNVSWNKDQERREEGLTAGPFGKGPGKGSEGGAGEEERGAVVVDFSCPALVGTKGNPSLLEDERTTDKDSRPHHGGGGEGEYGDGKKEDRGEQLRKWSRQPRNE